MDTYKCSPGVMRKCPDALGCDGTYNGTECDCAKDNQAFMPQMERDELKAYRFIGPVEEFRSLKEAEQKRRELWHSAEIPPDQDGLYWGKKDDTNSMWAVRYRSGVWSLSAYPDTKMPITEWAYWDAFEEEDSHDD